MQNDLELDLISNMKKNPAEDPRVSDEEDSSDAVGKPSGNHREKPSDVSVMLRETLILTVITLAAGLLLGFVYELTKDPIRRQQEKAVQEACQAVFPEEQDVSFELLKVAPSPELEENLSEDGVEIGSVYAAIRGDGAQIGYVVEACSSEGYNGDIVLYVGITMEGVLNQVSILSISETPGLGMRAEEVLLPQLKALAVEQIAYTKTGSEEEGVIDAISGATVTTKAVTNAVNGALRMAQELNMTSNTGMGSKGGAANE